jgi:hypothetical protein
MYSLTRRRFPDRLLDDADLDALSDLWFAWYEQARVPSSSGAVGYQRLEARLWGFARGQGDWLQALLTGRAAALLPQAVVERADPDTLTVAGPYVEFAQAWSPAALVALFHAGEFDGLPFMLRLSLHDWRDEPQGPPLAGGTLVVCGQLDGGSLRLKGIWSAGLAEGLEALYEKAAWHEEDWLLAALDDYHRTGRRPVFPETADFAPRPIQRGRHWALSRFIRFPTRNKLGAFLDRVAFFGVPLLGAVALLVWVLSWPWPEPWLLGALTALVVIPFLGLLHVVSKEFRRVANYHRRMTAALTRVYSQRLGFAEVDLAPLGLSDDPTVRKYTAELEALGCRHYLDVRTDPRPEGTTYIRLFALPAESTYVHLLLLFATKQFRLFPAKPTMVATTYLEEGRLTSINGGGGHRKQRNPRVIGRHFEDKDPATFVAKHCRVLRQLRDEGHRPVFFPGPQALLQRLTDDHEEARRFGERYGFYSWGAAFRQAFDLVRPEYRTDQE